MPSAPTGAQAPSGLGDSNVDVASAPLFDARQDDPELAPRERCRGAARVEGTRQAYRTREPPEAPLGEVKRRFLVRARARQLSARHDERALRKHDAQALRGHTRHVYHDLDAGRGFEDVHRGRAFPRGRGSRVVQQIGETRLVAAAKRPVGVLEIDVRHSSRIVQRRYLAGVGGELSAFARFDAGALRRDRARACRYPDAGGKRRWTIT
jgi:hypothetical protein